MKAELTILAAGSTAAAASGGAGLATGDLPLAVAMMAVGGICAVIGALYYRSNSDEGIVRDVIASLAMAFMLGAAAGAVAGAWLDAILFQALGLHMTVIAQSMIGGAALGLALTPLTRGVLAGKVGDILAAARDFLDKIGGKK